MDVIKKIIFVTFITMFGVGCEPADEETSGDDTLPALVDSIDLGTFKLAETISGSIQIIDNELSGISASCNIVSSTSVVESTVLLTYTGQNGQSAQLSIPSNNGYSLAPDTYSIDCTISDSTNNEVDVISALTFEVINVHVDCRYYGPTEGCVDSIPYSCPNSSYCSSSPTCENISCF